MNIWKCLKCISSGVSLFDFVCGYMCTKCIKQVCVRIPEIESECWLLTSFLFHEGSGLSNVHCLFRGWVSFCCLSPGTLLTLSVELICYVHGLFQMKHDQVSCWIPGTLVALTTNKPFTSSTDTRPTNPFEPSWRMQSIQRSKGSPRSSFSKI